MNDVAYYVLFDKICIQAANTVSSPITYGFPALSGFLGAIHALSRKLPSEYDMQLDGVLVACHQCEVKRYRPHFFADYTLNQTRNPVKKTGQTTSIIEEGKVDITVSLLVELRCDMDAYDWVEENKERLQHHLKQNIYQQRIAGGSVHDIASVNVLDTTHPDIKAALLPAFVLMDAKQDLVEITEELQTNNPEATTIDALLDVATLHHTPIKNESGQTEDWKISSAKTGRGWIVPIPIGFQAIAPQVKAGALKNCRTNEYDSHYVECLYSLGKWVFPHSIQDIKQGFWRYDNTHNDMYLIQQTHH